MDLNPHSLDSASAHLGAVEHRTVVADVLDPLPESIGPMDSIAANFLIHCLPGSWSEKGTAFRHLADRLSDRSEEHTSELQSRGHLVCRLLLEKKNIRIIDIISANC